MKIGCVICDRNGIQCPRPLEDNQYICTEHLRGMSIAERQRLTEVEKLTAHILNSQVTMDSIKAMHLIGLHLRQIQKATRQVEVRGRYGARFETRENR